MRHTIMVLLCIGLAAAQFEAADPRTLMNLMKQLMKRGGQTDVRPRMPQMVLVGMVEQPIPTPVAVPYSVPPPVYPSPTTYTAPAAYGANQAANPYAAEGNDLPYDALASL